MNALSGWACTAFHRLAPVLASLLVACGGGGSYSSEQDIPVRMTLAASTQDAHTVLLEWSGLSAAPTSYSLHIDGAFYRTEYPGDAGATSHRTRVGSLAAGTRYCFVVYAVYFPLGIGSRSNESCVTTPADTAPTAPPGASAVATSPARIDLAWNAASDDWGVAQYRIERDGMAAGTVGAEVLAYADTTVMPATRYCYAVRAVDGGGNVSPPSAPACASTPADTQGPAAPGFLSVSIDGTVATLTWGASEDDAALAAYRILRDGSVLREVPADGSAGAVSATDSALAAATQYCYEVVAVDRAGNASAASPRACATAGWTFATLAQAAQYRDAVGPGAVALDGAGRLHIAYGYTPWNAGANAPAPTELRYLTNAGGAWSDRWLHSPIDGSPAIAAGTAAVHVAYRQVRPYYLPLPAGPAELVAAETPQEIALAVDAAGTVQMALAGSGVRHAVRAPAGGWTGAPVSAVYPLGVSLALDRAGAAHVVFRDAAASAVHHATNAGGTWSVTTLVAGPVGSYYFPAVATDPTGGVHVVYTDDVTGRVMHATNRSGAWTQAVVDGSRSVGPTAIAVDRDGVVHVGYSSAGSPGALKYANDRGGTWRSFVLTQLDAPRFVGIVVDAAGRVSLVYGDYGGASMRLATSGP